jgi:hypothetical protein
MINERTNNNERMVTDTLQQVNQQLINQYEPYGKDI